MAAQHSSVLATPPGFISADCMHLSSTEGTHIQFSLFQDIIVVCECPKFFGPINGRMYVRICKQFTILDTQRRATLKR